MFNVISCVLVEHDLRYVAAAVLVCILGSLLTLRLFSRVRRTTGLQKVNWLFLTGIIGGATTWTTHFVAMLGYLSGGPAGYEPLITLLSLLIAVGTAIVGFGIASYAKRSAFVEAGGAIMGLGIGLMHYTGMAAFLVQGRGEWNLGYILASLLFGAAFGAVATNRIVRPITRFCKYGGVSAMVLAIAITHFTGMASLTVVIDPRAVMPAEFLSAEIMGAGVLAIMFLLLALGASTYAIDSQSNLAAVERYRHLSLHDPLTALPNRTAFNEHLSALIDGSAQHDMRVAILSFDLDRFKEINDVHGHAAGDAVLMAVSERITGTLHAGEFVARVGGDEFIAVTRNYFARADAAAMAQRLVEQIVRPVDWNGQVLSIGTSVGIAVFPSDARTMDDLVAQADVAMSRAKSTATNTICFYDSSMDLAARERNALAVDMRHGIERGEFELYYQRQNDTISRAVIGFEVLLRWRHRDRGMISPVEFIPIAEKTGFILELGEWVLRMACTEAATWKNPLRIAVNVAPQQLADARLPATVHQILFDTGLAPGRLELEITETGIIADQQHALHVIRQLKALGVKVAMDDYGTGYSSLSTLQSFPFDKIKIDRAFVDGIETNRQSAAIVRSTLILAASLDIPVLAEGVETERHIEFLRDEGCGQVQGYLFGRPVPRSDIEEIVNRPPDVVAPVEDTAAPPTKIAFSA